MNSLWLIEGLSYARRPAERLVIDLDSSSLTLDGTTHQDIDSSGLRIVAALHQAARNGNPYLSGKTLSQTVPGCAGGEKTVRRVIGRLPGPLRNLIVGEKGKGYFLKLPPPK